MAQPAQDSTILKKEHHEWEFYTSKVTQNNNQFKIGL